MPCLMFQFIRVGLQLVEPQQFSGRKQVFLHAVPGGFIQRGNVCVALVGHHGKNGVGRYAGVVQ